MESLLSVVDGEINPVCTGADIGITAGVTENGQ
jgi:hypothetical protein